MKNQFTKRRLVLCISGLLATNAGCLAQLNSNNQKTKQVQEEHQKPTLEYVLLSNHDDRQHFISVTIFQGDERVYNETHQVPEFDAATSAAGTKLIEPPSFNSEPASWSISATKDGGEGAHIDLEELPHDGGCINITVRISPEGKILMLNDTPDC